MPTPKRDFHDLRCGQCEFLFYGVGLLRCPACGSLETERVDVSVLSDSDAALLETALSSAATKWRELAELFREDPRHSLLVLQFETQAEQVTALRSRMMAAASVTLAVSRA